MFIYGLENRNAVITAVEQELKNIGIKHISKLRTKISVKKSVPSTAVIFHRPLEQLPQQVIQLQSGQYVSVPCILVDMCEFLHHRLDTEGIFRKAGSIARQKQIKEHIESGKCLSQEFHEIDIANILKLFLRELPEPLIPSGFQEIFVRCYDQSNLHVLQACLLLPPRNLCVLAYLLQFFNSVASSSELNLMPAHNLAIVLVPALMPVTEAKGLDITRAKQLDVHALIIQFLIEHAERIGELSAELMQKLGYEPTASIDEIDCASVGSLDSLGPDRKNRKRRSGSLTRVFNGIKKFVGRHTSPPATDNFEYQPGEQTSPCIISAEGTKKRRLDSAFGHKKKLEVIHSLPASSLLPNTPARFITDSSVAPNYFFTTPVCTNPNPNPQKSITKSPHPQVLRNKQKKLFTPKVKAESLITKLSYTENKKPIISFNNKKSSKKQSQVMEKDSPIQKPTIKRKMSWSSLSNSLGMRRFAANTELGTPLLQSPYAVRGRCMSVETGLNISNAVDLSPVKNPVNFSQEYQEIKSKVENLENKLNEEINKAEQNRHDRHSASLVQTEYQRTLEDSEPFNTCHTTDQLAKRLSRELKIRRSGENKIIRSPSARKIGSLRRRSKELINKPVLRTASLSKISRSPIRSTYPMTRGLKRGKPNTLMSGLPLPSPGTTVKCNAEISLPIAVVEDKFKHPSPPVTRSSSFKTNTPEVKSVVKFSSLRNLEQDNAKVYSPPVTRSSSFKAHTPPIQNTVKSRIITQQSRVTSPPISRPSPFRTPQIPTPAKARKNTEEHWFDATDFMKKATPLRQDNFVGRPSIAEIKRNRAGMVLASVKLFNSHVSPEITKQQCNDDEIFKTPATSMKYNRKPLSDGGRHELMPRSLKINSSLPVGKENPCSPYHQKCFKKTVKSPLAIKNCNKISENLLITPTKSQDCPVIKKPMSVHPIDVTSIRRTPFKVPTPSKMKPMTPIRRSPRLLSMLNVHQYE